MDPTHQPSRRKIPWWLPQVLGYAVSAVCLLWVLHKFELAALIASIRDLEWRWVALAVVADLTAYIVSAWRWNTLLGPVARLGFWRTVQAIYIGLFANEVLPLRVGEVIRCYLLTHWNDLRISLGFASAAVERLIDGLWLLAGFIVMASLVPSIPENLVLFVQFGGALLVMASILLFWVVTRKQEAHAVMRESRWSATLRHVIEGLHLMGNVQTMTKTAAISLLYLFIQVVSVWALMKAYKTDFSFWVAGGVLIIIRLVTVVPNAPGNLGVINAACVMALKLFDMKVVDATAFSFIIFGALTFPLLIGGAIATALSGINIGEIRDRAHRGARAANTPPAVDPTG